MNPCARACCWVPMPGVCARQRTCPCHAADRPRDEPQGSDARVYRNPTQDEAIRNIMRDKRRRKQ